MLWFREIVLANAFLLQGDLPMTVFTTAHSGVHFTPVNYLEGSPSVETVNMVRIRQVP
jgi:hypothetical protein